LDPNLGKNHSNLATLDHVVPISKGGGITDLNNVVIACWPCNNKKGDNII
jgi:5-methylcytosine-specific restriction endonuclease McrA